MNHQTLFVPQIAYQSPQVTTQPMTESPPVDLGFAVPVFSPGCLAVASSRFPSTNNQLRTSSNLRNQATIQDGRVSVQQVQGRLGQNYSSTGYKSNATSSGGNNASGQAKVVKCYNCQGEGHMARQCNQSKRPRNAACYKDKAMLAEAQEAGQILDEEQLAFLVDLGVPDGEAVQTIISNNVAFQTEDLDTYDYDYDDISNAKAVLMANISNYGSDAISKDFEQTPSMDVTDNEITSDSNIIPYSQYLQETQQANVQDTNWQAQQDSMILSVIEQMSEKMINHKARRIKPTLYDRIVMSAKHVAMLVIDDEETLILEEESRSKILSDDFGKRFTLQQELLAEQAFWLRMSNPTSKPSDASPVRIEAPKELPRNMNTTQAQQKALDALVVPADHLKFIKIVIDYFMSKDQSISRRNKMFWHTARDDTMFTSMRCISRHEDTQVYGTILPTELTNQAMLESKAYQTYYAFASREKAPKPKYIRKKADSNTSPKKKPVQATKGTRLKSKAKVAKPNKKKQPTKKTKAKGLAVLSETFKKDKQSKVLDEQQQKTSGTNEGTGTIIGVPDVPIYESKSEKESWGDNDDETRKTDL
ncbi:uncharacterized mitochondrial protein-like protein [Tanacetum coccineum]